MIHGTIQFLEVPSSYVNPGRPKPLTCFEFGRGVNRIGMQP